MSVDTQKLFAELISAMGREGITYRENNANKRRKRGAGETSTLDQYARDLTDMARQGKEKMIELEKLGHDVMDNPENYKIEITEEAEDIGND
jgi:hypothetical protein